MDQINRLPSFDASFSYLCSSASGLVDQEQQFGTTEQQPIYQGMPVQVLNPISIYNSGPSTYQNEANHSNSLNKYNIESLTNFDLENAPGTSIQEIPQSILDEYVPYQPDYEPVNDALLLTPDTPFQQLISWDELEIREQTTANHTSSGLQLTNLPAGIHSSQDLRPVAVVSPLLHQATRDNQATQVAVNVDGSSSLVKRKRELRKDPAYAKCERERKRKCYQTDPAYAERERERKRKRYQTDPAYAERERERKRELRKDPAYAERERDRQRERNRKLRKDPAYAERERDHQRERYQSDPAYAERKRKRKRERYQSDPAYAERKRKRYQTDPAYAERKRKRQRELKRERYQTDPAYAEGQRIYLNTYSRIKRQTSNKKEAKEQAVIARDQYLQSVNLAKNSGDLPLTSNLTETTQSSSKNLDGTAHPAFQSSK